MTYYAYWYAVKSGEKHFFDLKMLLDSYTKFASDTCKKSITTEFNEKLFLFYVLNDVYMLVITKDSEIIKAINENKMEHSDIYSKLASNESLGFASYLYVQKDFFGIGATYFGPKISKFVYFVNEILKYLSIRNGEFKVLPFGIEATKDEVLTMPFVGKTTIEIGPENSLAKRIQELVGWSDIQDETESFIFTIKPYRGKGIKKSFSALAEALGDHDLKKFVVKGKEELSDAATDFYIVGKGAVSDMIPTKIEKEIPNEIVKRCERNSRLTEKIKQFQEESGILDANQTATSVACFDKCSSWDYVNRRFDEI